MELKYTFFSAELWGGIFCVVVAASLYESRKRRETGSSCLIGVLTATGLMLIFDAVAWYFRGAVDLPGSFFVRAGNFLSFLACFIIPVFVYYYLLSIIEDDDKREIIRWEGAPVFGVCIFNIILLIISQFNGMLYYVDSSGIYHRGIWFPFVSILNIVLFVIFIVSIISERKYISKERCRAVFFYLLIPVAAAAVQIFVYGYSIMNLTCVLAAANIFVADTGERVRKMDAQENRIDRQNEEIVNLQTRIALSQIKPHFLYNTLNSIYILCGDDLETGRQAISDLSDYLRVSIGSMESQTPIPFEKEMDHVKTYMAIESLRFPDELDFSVVTPVTGFTLPPLTLQPLVENAVRHGIVPTGKEGIILITTRENEDSYIVTISDNGAGFDVESLKEEEEGHIGIRNVRERLKLQVNATLEISSIIGSGTEVTIRIPKTA